MPSCNHAADVGGAVRAVPGGATRGASPLALVLDAIRNGDPMPAHAASFQDAAALRLKRAGWRVLREVPVALPGQRRLARVDLVASYGAWRVAVACDRLAPRRKTIATLLACDVDTRLVLLRGQQPLHVVDGVCVLGLEVTR